jgi:hypothetical protein
MLVVVDTLAVFICRIEESEEVYLVLFYTLFLSLSISVRSLVFSSNSTKIHNIIIYIMQQGNWNIIY